MQDFAFTISVHYQKENGSRKARPFCLKNQKTYTKLDLLFI